MVNVELWEEKKREQKMTFDELSKRSGIPKRTILGIFRKEVLTPRIDTVQAIERALGIGGQTLEWTEEDRAQGVVDSVKITVSAEEIEWLEIRSELIRLKGEKFFETLSFMLETIIEEKI